MKETKKILEIASNIFNLDSKFFDIENIKAQNLDIYTEESKIIDVDVKNILFYSSEYIIQHNIISLNLLVNKNCNDEFKELWKKFCYEVSLLGNDFEISIQSKISCFSISWLSIVVKMQNKGYYTLSITIGKL